MDLIVGRLGRARGLAGELFVNLRADSPAERFRVGTVLRAGEASDAVRLTVASFRDQGGRGLIRFKEVVDRSGAEALTGVELLLTVDDHETADEEDTYYDHQLVGLSVVAATGRTLGRVSRVDHLGFQDMLAVETAAGERLVPFVTALVPRVDLVAGEVVVEAIPGLLEDNDEA
ncbi:MAG: ribosome maturation factor RimM [Propionibacteriaceae bacterium]|jgi:16S rRNA processing protein RimM|nr:ribosome maturation factor RimM [Propionibacteriaceae bacterium]